MSCKVAGSISDWIIAIFHLLTSSGLIIALKLTQPVTDMSNRNISGGKGSACVGLTILPYLCANFLEILEA
jgi:hypothetical protein